MTAFFPVRKSQRNHSDCVIANIHYEIQESEFHLMKLLVLLMSTLFINDTKLINPRS